MEENRQPEEGKRVKVKSVFATIADVIKTLIFLAIIVILIWYFFFRDEYPKALTEEMVTSDALLSAAEDLVVEDINASGINDVLWSTDGCYIIYADLSVSDQVREHPENYMVGDRVKVEPEDAPYILMEASGLAEGDDTVYQYNFSLPMVLDPVYTDDVTEFHGDTSHTVQVDGAIWYSSLGFRVNVTEITYSEEFQQALDLSGAFGWMADIE